MHLVDKLCIVLAHTLYHSQLNYFLFPVRPHHSQESHYPPADQPAKHMGKMSKRAMRACHLRLSLSSLPLGIKSHSIIYGKICYVKYITG